MRSPSLKMRENREGKEVKKKGNTEGKVQGERGFSYFTYVYRGLFIFFCLKTRKERLRAGVWGANFR